ncbi:unnamed protein product [Cuscuta campestris]|uniref:Uncharacterized protein n=1 Tax=Cuscuta campestris TaxID=132261 RepID=A0A484L4M4_9ASTE|nr:unnamed protein product [Cuscuta campestris]
MNEEISAVSFPIDSFVDVSTQGNIPVRYGYVSVVFTAWVVPGDALALLAEFGDFFIDGSRILILEMSSLLWGNSFSEIVVDSPPPNRMPAMNPNLLHM